MNNLISRFQRFVARLSFAQRVTAGTLVVVMVVVGFWATNRATTDTSLVAILDQPFAEADVLRISEHLRTKATPFQVRDGKVLVSAERRFDVLSDLYYSGVLTAGTESGFDALVKQISAWDAPSKTDKMFNHAREVTVQQVIGTWDSVRKVTVIIDPTNERRLGGTILPSAMVDIQTRGGGNARKLASGAINVITGAVANLDREQVKVTVDGATFNAGGESLAAAELVERRQQSEQIHVAKVRQLLSYIPDVLVSVSVETDQPIEPPAKVEEHAALEKPSPAEPTVIANAVPLLQELSAVANAASSAEAPAPPVEAKRPAPRPLVDSVRSASVAVPRSYFEQIYLRANKKALEPTDALLQPVIDAHIPKIRSLVKNALGLEKVTDVSVEPYEDGLATAAAPHTAAVTTPLVKAASLASSPILTINSYAREIALGTFGLLAVALASLMFRRTPVAAPAATIASVLPSEPRAIVTGTIHEAASAGADDVEAHHLFRRVRDMVTENPDDAARVLRGWIHQS